MLERIISIGIGYVFGLFQTAYIYGRFHHIDIRNYGSGNAGTTNALRTLGKKAGLVTFLGDFLKPMIAAMVVYFIYRNSYPEYVILLSFYAGIGSVFGHVFPCYLGFRGGKGIASIAGLGVWFGIASGCWYVIPIGIVTFIVVVGFSKYVSLGSLCLIGGYLIEMLLFGQMGILNIKVPYLYEVYGIIACLTLLVFWKHSANIKRLLAGTENKLVRKKKEE